MDSNSFLIVLNFIVCTLGGWVCICRAGAMQGHAVKVTIRVQYAMWFMLLAASGWSFLYKEPATLTQFALSVGVLCHLLIGFAVWRHGPPPYTSKAPRTA